MSWMRSSAADWVGGTHLVIPLLNSGVDVGKVLVEPAHGLEDSGAEWPVEVTSDDIVELVNGGLVCVASHGALEEGQ